MEANEPKKKLLSMTDWVAIFFCVILCLLFAIAESFVSERDITIHKQREIEKQKMDEQLELNAIYLRTNNFLAKRLTTFEHEVELYKYELIPAYDSLLKTKGINQTKKIESIKQKLHFK